MICRLVVPPQGFEHFDVISVVDKSTDHGKLLLICLFCFVLFLFFHNNIHESFDVLFQSIKVSRRIASVMLCRIVVPQQSFEHFDVISMVDKSTDHGKLLLTCLFVCFFFEMTLKVFITSISIEVCRRIASARKKETNCATVTLFPWNVNWSVLLSKIAVN